MNSETYEPGPRRGSDFEPKSAFAPDPGSDEREVLQSALIPEILDSISDAFYAVDKNWRLVFVNRTIEQWWGRPRAELLGRNLWDEFPQAIGSESYQAHLTAAKERKPVRLETQSPILGRWVDLRIHPIGENALAVYFNDISERKRAEEALLDSEARLREAILCAPFPIMLHAEDGEVLVLSRKWSELTGYTRQEMRTHSDWARLACADARERFEAEVLRAFGADAERAAGEWEICTRDGSKRVWDFYQVALGRLADGRRLQMSAAVDVTERRAAEETLRSNQVRLARKARLLELSHDAILVWDLEGEGISFWNRAAEDLYGYTREEALGRITHDLLKSKLPMPCEAFHAMLKRKGSWAGELVHTTKDGRRITVESRHVLVTEAGGRATVLETNRDVTARKRAEERLRKLNEGLEAQVAERTRERDLVWRTSQDLFVIIGPDGRYRAVNPAWTSALGYTAEELIGMEASALVHPDDLVAKAAEIEPLARGQAIRDVDLRIRTKDGEYRWFNWTATPAGNDELYAEGRDITERKALEEQLRQAQKMEAIGQLTGGIAHDFNNLLTGIIGSLELLERRLGQGRTKDLEKYVSAATTSANRAAALIHRLLAFSRRQPLEPKPVDANRLIASMEDLLRRTLRENIQLELVTAGGLWRTLCDPHQLESAILNLAINARDAMPNGGRLTIETCNCHLDRAYAAANRDAKPGQYVCICVTDTGTGMPPDVAARAFDPFFTTKPIGQGTGLGLSMIYGFIRQSEGHVKIYSEPGQGTTVKLYLPRRRGDIEEEAEPPTAGSPDARAAGGEVVLLVEDDQSVRDLVLEVLRDIGYSALVAADGPSGLSLVEQAPRLDLLITDVGLPGLNGRQLAEAAREFKPGLKVLFMTGYAENAAVGAGFLEPGTELISKPFPLDALASRVRQMIEGQAD